MLSFDVVPNRIDELRDHVGLSECHWSSPDFHSVRLWVVVGEVSVHPNFNLSVRIESDHFVSYIGLLPELVARLVAGECLLEDMQCLLQGKLAAQLVQPKQDSLRPNPVHIAL